MGRPRDFDADAALDAAVQLFWERGFVATSVRHLCDAMGIRAGSFYAVFGSKEGCFQRALARYLERQPVPREPGPDAIRAWLDAIVDPKRTPKGCLLVGSVLEHPNLDAVTQRIVTGHLESIEAFFRASLRNRSAASDGPPTAAEARSAGVEVGGRRERSDQCDHPDSRGDAALLAATVLAIHVRARAGAKPKELRALADRALEAVALPPARRRLARS